MQFEDLLQATGGFGRYQKLLSLILVSASTAIVGAFYYVQLIVLFVPNFTCEDHPYGNDTADNNTSSEIDHCWYADEDDIDVPCRNWNFDETYIFPTFSVQQKWMCSAAWRPVSIVTSFWVGNVVGAWGLGIAADKYGRKPVIGICFLVYGVFGLLSAFATSFWTFLACRTLVGSVHHTLAHLPYILVVEYCDMKHRVVPLFTTMMSYTLGSMLAPLLAFLIWDWYWLLVVSSAPCLLILAFYRYIPESASWLITQGKLEQASDTLFMISQTNGCKLSTSDITDMLNQMCVPLQSTDREEEGECSKDKDKQEEAEKLTSVFKYPIVRLQIATCMFTWMVGCLCYYGHSQNTGNLSDNVLKSFFMGSLVEIPAWLAPVLIERLGRKLPLFLSYVAAGVAGILYCAAYGALAPSLELSLALFGRMTMTAAYFITLQYVPEIFPTAVRGQGIALAETMGGAAIFVSPLIVHLDEVVPSLPLLIFGVLGLGAALVSLLLPETKGKALPDTLCQAEAMARANQTQRTWRTLFH